METKAYQKKVKYIIGLGFTKEQAQNALLIHNNDQTQATEYLLYNAAQTSRSSAQGDNISFDQSSQKSSKTNSAKQPNVKNNRSPPIAIGSEIPDEEEAQLKMALAESMITSASKTSNLMNSARGGSQSNFDGSSIKPNQSSANRQSEACWSPIVGDFYQQYEPMNAEDRQRLEREPVGLKNIGNTCYFNCLIQAYFYIPTFLSKVITSYGQPIPLQQTEDDMQANRQRQSTFLVENLGKLFAQMIQTNKKYVDPTQVLRSLTDDFGNFIHVGEQRDIGEFNLNFLERIEEGLGELQQKSEDSHNKNNPNLTFEQMASKLHQPQGITDVIDSESINAGLDLQFSNIAVDKKEESKIKLVHKNEGQEMIQNLKESFPTNSKLTMKEIFFGSKLEVLKLIHSEKKLQVDDFLATSQFSISPDPSPIHLNQEIVDKISSRQEKLGAIYLDIKPGQRLYEAWDEAFQDDVPDFVQPEMRDQQTCKKETWIYEEPQVLFFSLQRVKYDKAQQRAVKRLDPFSFDKIIYADMFLYKNHLKATQIRQKIESMKVKIQKIGAKLREYQSFKNEGQISLEAQLSNCEGYLSRSIDKQELVPEIDLKKAIQVLKIFQKSVSMKYQDLQSQLTRLTSQIDNAFIKERECPYFLHSIVVHDGLNAESGHYYSFVFDRSTQLWYRFNDHTVTTETEEKVFEESFGGTQSGKCAYSLVYVSAKVETMLNDLPLQSYSMNENVTSNLCPQLKQHVYESNYKFDKELTDHKVDKIGKAIVEKLKQRTEIIRQYTETQQQLVTQSLINFPAYLKCNNNAVIMRWILLNDCVREEHPAQLDLRNLSTDDIIYQGLAAKYFSPQFLKMQTQVKEKLEQQFSSYKNYQSNCCITAYIIVNLSLENTDSWKTAISTYLFFKSTSTATSYQGDQTLALCLDACRIFVLHVIFQALLSFKQRQTFPNVLNYCNLAATVTVLTLESSDIHFKQVYAGIERLQKLTKMYLKGNYTKEVENSFETVLIKIKKGMLNKEERLVPELSSQIKSEVADFEAVTLDQNQWVEGWKPESIAFRYFNIIAMFRAKNSAALTLHSELLKKKKPFNDEDITQFEIKNLGFNINQVIV